MKLDIEGLSMTSRERTVISLNHETPDRIPLDIGGTFVTTMHISCVSELRRYYGLDGLAKLGSPSNMTGIIEEDLKKTIGSDIQELEGMYNGFGFKNENWKEWVIPQGHKVLVPGDFNVTDDGKGGYYLYPAGDTSAPPSGHLPEGGYYFDAVTRQDPIDDDNLNPEDNLQEFTYITDEMLEYYRYKAKEAAATGRYVIGNFGGTAIGNVALLPVQGIRHPKGIRDIEEWYMSTLIRQDYLHRVFEKQTDIALSNYERIYEAVGDLVDAVFICGTDMGTQTGPFLSIESFRSLYMPYYKKINGWIHENTHWKTMKHSCGSIRAIIPHFIESGFDILNPVQYSADNMNLKDLKREFGMDITFHGGGVDTQKILPFGTPEEVRDEVLRNCDIMGENGGFIFGAVHCIQANTPVENIVAMIDAVHEFNGR